MRPVQLDFTQRPRVQVLAVDAQLETISTAQLPVANRVLSENILQRIRHLALHATLGYQPRTSPVAHIVLQEPTSAGLNPNAIHAITANHQLQTPLLARLAPVACQTTHQQPALTIASPVIISTWSMKLAPLVVSEHLPAETMNSLVRCVYLICLPLIENRALHVRLEPSWIQLHISASHVMPGFILLRTQPIAFLVPPGSRTYIWTAVLNVDVGP